MSGIFSISNTDELYQKLLSDYGRLKEDPTDKNIAFDFFVTAESLVDWYLPGKTNKKARENLRNNSLELQIVSHIASGAKHFKVEAKHHKSISGSRETGGWFNDKWFSKKELYIDLDGAAKQQLGSTITALELATRVKKYWEKELP